MKEESAIKISMLIDGELSEQASSDLIDEIQKDKALQAVWSRYQAASSLLRSETSCIAPSGFSNRVTESLQAEPTVLAPKKASINRFDRAAIGAIAASVVVFTVMVGGTLETSPAPPSSASSLNLASNAPVLEEKAALDRSPIQVAESEAEEEVWIQDEQLNDYLMKHSEKTRSAGAFGVLPLARVVSYGSGR